MSSACNVGLFLGFVMFANNQAAIILEGDSAAGHLNRSDNRTDQRDIVVNLLIYADYTVYSRWLEVVGDRGKALNYLKSYFSHVTSEANKIFSTIDEPSYKIEINLADLYIAESSESLNISGYRTNSIKSKVLDQLISSLEDWVNIIEANFENFNVFVFFTNETLLLNGSVDGLAVTHSACKKIKPVTIVRMSNIIKNAYVLSHELAHVFGASHDGLKGNNCLAEDSYVMAAKYSDKNAIKKFSSCSKKNFKDFFDSLKKNCLLRSVNPASRNPFPEAIMTSPGRVLDPNVQCKLIFGSYSYYYHYSDKNVCNELTCRFYNKTNYVYLAYPNTTCGAHKSCQNGQCLNDSLTENDKESCLYGDEPEVFVRDYQKYYECSMLNSRLCYIGEYQRRCCQTCAAAKNISRPENCWYGDKLEDLLEYRNESFRCSMNMSGFCYNEKYADKCCQTCADAKDAGNPDCPYGDIAGPVEFNRKSLECSKENSVHCKHQTYAKHCCKLCAAGSLITKSLLSSG
ncbi:hypothetical protein HELRODRAFT_168863 [Helobdella robusta]|uniref:Peptidase M12B domain-containing protein n=1 Tax=Helobdella robusta TaxID=6412 RepID=T1F124_HELRO|nr:hypothetical protein HELRODRAFT_168863 [Helobdella robusta]ESO08942.1 hypothetical protein HELRODRAFT_168863 [Helobdella robusta]